jgi:DHA1 family bicyclomycin/chloramphenicol resistance-like MFS transporter
VSLGNLSGQTVNLAEPRKPPPLALLAALTALGFCALHMVIPVLPLLTRVFDSEPLHVQPVITLYFAGIAVGQLIYGPISDRYGRRPVLLVGLAMFLAGSVLCVVAGSLWWLVVGRVLQACGACAGIVLGRAVIRDVHDREGSARALALVMMVMTLAPAISPAIGAYLAEWVDWRAIFVLLAMLGVLVLAWTWARLAETNASPAPLDLGGMAVSYLALLRSPAFLAFGLCTALTSASWFTFTAAAPFLLSEVLHEPPSTYGLMILLPMATYMIGNGVAARATRRFGSMRLFVWGLTISLCAGALMAAWCLSGRGLVWALFVPVAIASIGSGLCQPPAMAAGLSIYPRMAGAASGVIGFMQMTASSIGTLAAGLLPQQSVIGTVAVVVTCMVLAMVTGLLALRLSRSALPVRAAAPLAVKPGPVPAPGNLSGG